MRGLASLIIAATSSCGSSNTTGCILGQSIKRVLFAMEQCSVGFGIGEGACFRGQICCVQPVVRTTFGGSRRIYLDTFYVLSALSEPRGQAMLAIRFLKTSCLVCWKQFGSPVLLQRTEAQWASTNTYVLHFFTYRQVDNYYVCYQFFHVSHKAGFPSSWSGLISN